MKPEKMDGPQDSFNLASQAVSDAVAFDNKHNYREAHDLYLKAVTLFEQSMDAEANETKLNVLKNRIAAYKKRATELDSFLKEQTVSNAHPIRVNDLEVEMGITKKTIDSSPAAATDTRLERMVYALGVVVGVLLVAVVAMFAMLQVHIAENADLNTELEVTQNHLSTVAASVMRLSSAPADEASTAQSVESLFNELENMNSGVTLDYAAEIAEVKLGLTSMSLLVDAKADLSTVESLASQVETNWMNVDSSIGDLSSSMTVLESAKADAAEVYGKSEIEAVLNQVDLRLSSEVSGLAGTMNDFSGTLVALGDDLTTLGTTSADALHDLEASFSGVVLQLHEDVQTLESGLETKANSDDVRTKQEALLSVINVVEVLSGTTMDLTVAETFFTEEASHQVDLSHLGFADFEETINEDLAEVREDVDSLEADMDESVRSIEEQLASLVTLVNAQPDEDRVGEMIALAVEDLDIAGILASVAAALEAADSVDGRVDDLDALLAENEAAYNVIFEDLDSKMLQLGDSIHPVQCSFNGRREIFAGNSGCSDDMIVHCSDGFLHTLQVRC